MIPHEGFNIESENYPKSTINTTFGNSKSKDFWKTFCVIVSFVYLFSAFAVFFAGVKFRRNYEKTEKQFAEYVQIQNQSYNNIADVLSGKQERYTFKNNEGKDIDVIKSIVYDYLKAKGVEIK